MPTLITPVRFLTRVVVAIAIACTMPAHAVTIDWVTVGDPGNVVDTTGYGAVVERFRIGKYEVTIGQYAGFLNAVARFDPHGLYSEFMTSEVASAGISRVGASGSYSYNVIGPSGMTPVGASSPDKRPITYVSWFDAARFVNWMCNGQPVGPQGPTTTENGAYNVDGLTSGAAPALNATNPNTGTAPLYRIPTENEWYKAAYYSPLLNSESGGYYTYATQSNTAPGNTIGSALNQANYRPDDGAYSVTQSGTLSPNQNYLTDVGAFTQSASFSGTFDQSGNACEWNDLAGAASLSRGLRGGWWFGDANFLSSFDRFAGDPSIENAYVGFRLASPVPEPSNYALAFAALACGGWRFLRGRRA